MISAYDADLTYFCLRDNMVSSEMQSSIHPWQNYEGISSFFKATVTIEELDGYEHQIWFDVVLFHDQSPSKQCRYVFEPFSCLLKSVKLLFTFQSKPSGKAKSDSRKLIKYKRHHDFIYLFYIYIK